MSHHVCHVRQTQNKFLSRPHPSFMMTRRGVLELLDSVCCCWRGYSQSHSLHCCCLPVFCLFFYIPQSFPCSFELMRLAFLLLMRLLDSSFGHFLEMIHKLLDDKIATSPFLTKKRSNKHPTCLQANLILVVLTCWGYASVCESSTHYSHNSNSRTQTSLHLQVLRQLH